MDITELYTSHIVDMDKAVFERSQPNSEHSIFHARKHALSAIINGVVVIAGMAFLLLGRTLACAFVLPPSRVFRLLCAKNENLERKFAEFENETAVSFNLKNVTDNALSIVNLVLGISSDLFLGFFCSPALNIQVHAGLGFVSPASLKSVPRWAEQERKQAEAVVQNYHAFLDKIKKTEQALHELQEKVNSNELLPPGTSKQKAEYENLKAQLWYLYFYSFTTFGPSDLAICEKAEGAHLNTLRISLNRVLMNAGYHPGLGFQPILSLNAANSLVKDNKIPSIHAAIVLWQHNILKTEDLRGFVEKEKVIYFHNAKDLLELGVYTKIEDLKPHLNVPKIRKNPDETALFLKSNFLTYQETQPT
jgi:hypothetical protein